MDVFGRLAPFIQDFIYQNKWEELHGNQVAACEVIFDSDDNLLLSSGTASGKTEVAFLPVARRNNGETPVCLEEADYTPAEYGEALAWLELKGLVSLDYDLPLRNFDYAAYGENFLHGSAALTAAGQEAVEILELQGIEI